jgi:hypothetical protein
MSLTNDLRLGVYPDTVLLSPYGRTFKIEEVELARVDRTASGKMAKDIVAVKKRFVLEYEMIDTPELNTFLYYYDLQTELYFTYHTESALKEHYILMQPIDRTRFRLVGEGLWTGVSVTLEEV